jgi:2-methylisocitrate lyase-like PEP mutase family enzyme
MDDKTSRFRSLHDAGFFVMPNPWDIGSALRLEHLGFPAVATTSSGHAWSLGLEDQQLTLDQLVDHVRALTAVLAIPLSVDSERLYADSSSEIATNVQALADAGASGISIEDYEPQSGTIDDVATAAERVAAAAEAAHRTGIVLTARAENHLYGVDDLADTVARLIAYQAAGADVVYAPGPRDPTAIRTVVEEVQAPVNVLLRPRGPSPAELAELGVRRASTGGALAHRAYRAMEDAARDLIESERE